ncbi:tripartite tricarboxylate transporter substrate binding protein [Bradyrhizobium sp. LHD-71]|uniref:Bug family tripartite tricarboxylate transporter substrate binding protein n=1 Tax=Bradyrhizobium sp. LHD-71 TaxID=3072141 RepID=UPI00280F69D4|nr:tripartite tricarboxylate transporter substrate binding protein [Bradyrhizobium sp. LHD-71]MDQ8727511.1 tripartite tricarboxylate transporter substrate binding protein [Bradyrhizobium sp. LHD-71]
MSDRAAGCEVRDRRTMLKATAGAAALTLLGGRVAIAFPNQPITMIVPYAPGTTDQLARSLGGQMEKTLGKPLVAETRPGGGGTVGANFVAKSAKPDGHTLLFSFTAPLTIAPYQNPLPYSFDDLKAVSRVTLGPNMVAARVGAPFKDAKEMVAYAKANPEKVSFGSAGAGSTTHLAGEGFARAAGIKVNHIPFQGVTPAVTAAVGGTVDLVIGLAQALWPQIEGKKLVPIAQLGSTRASVIPDVPTFKELGVDFVMPAIIGVWAPAATPDDVVKQIAGAVEKAAASVEFLDFAKRTLTEVEVAGPLAFQSELEAERKLYQSLLADLGMMKK